MYSTTIKISNEIKNNCNDVCFNDTHKIIFKINKCIDKCSNDPNYKYEYKNVCYSTCPTGTNKKDNEYICEESDENVRCEHFYFYDFNHTECHDIIPEGYYLNDSMLKLLDKCHSNCKTCNKKYNETNNNCLTCKQSLFFNFGNCILNCSNGFFTDLSNNNICKCPFNKKCKECSEESIYHDLCISCNNDEHFYQILNDNENQSSFMNCSQELERYYVDNNILKPCYHSCKNCFDEGNEYIHNCLECNTNYSFINDSEKIGNCYEKCEFYYFFDSENKYICTLNYSCPVKYSKLIKEKNKCIDYCDKDDIYIYEFNNTCYEFCPNGTHNSSENYLMCEEDLICEKYYNYEYTKCLDNIPNGYYLNDSIAKTIDKCDVKCNSCDNESVYYNLCISCNNETGYYPKENDISNRNTYINCYNFTFEAYFLDTLDKI